MQRKEQCIFIQLNIFIYRNLYEKWLKTLFEAGIFIIFKILQTAVAIKYFQSRAFEYNLRFQIHCKNKSVALTEKKTISQDASKRLFINNLWLLRTFVYFNRFYE